MTPKAPTATGPAWGRRGPDRTSRSGITRRGELIRGEDGGALVARADPWMAGPQDQDPARMTALMAPGVPR